MAGQDALDDRACQDRGTTRERLLRRRIAQFLGRSVASISRPLAALRRSDLKARDPVAPIIRYKRGVPGDLQHLDAKKLGHIEPVRCPLPRPRSQYPAGAVRQSLSLPFHPFCPQLPGAGHQAQLQIGFLHSRAVGPRFQRTMMEMISMSRASALVAALGLLCGAATRVLFLVLPADAMLLSRPLFAGAAVVVSFSVLVTDLS